MKWLASSSSSDTSYVFRLAWHMLSPLVHRTLCVQYSHFAQLLWLVYLLAHDFLVNFIRLRPIADRMTNLICSFGSCCRHRHRKQQCSAMWLQWAHRDDVGFSFFITFITLRVVVVVAQIRAGEKRVKEIWCDVCNIWFRYDVHT